MTRKDEMPDDRVKVWARWYGGAWLAGVFGTKCRASSTSARRDAARHCAAKYFGCADDRVALDEAPNARTTSPKSEYFWATRKEGA